MNPAEPAREEESRAGAWLGMAIVGVILLPFLPLLFAIVESTLFHSHYVEDFFRRVGLHEVLSRLYQSPVAFIRHFFD